MEWSMPTDSGCNVCGEEEDTDEAEEEEEDSSQAPDEEEGGGVARLTSPVTRLRRDSGQMLPPLWVVLVGPQVELGAGEGSRLKRPL